MKAAIWQDRASGSWNLSLYVDGVLDTDCSLAKGGEATDLCRAATKMGFKLNEIPMSALGYANAREKFKLLAGDVIEGDDG